MKKLDDLIEYFKTHSGCIDGRDRRRLADFIPERDMEKLGLELHDEFKGKHTPRPWTRENVLAQLKEDVRFGIEKASNQRGISASLMYQVVQMWNWALQDGLEDFDDYGSYGRPLFVATAEKYGWPTS